MRYAAFADSQQIFTHYGISTAVDNAIDVGGTETVYLNRKGVVRIERNPLLALIPELRFLDAGFNIDELHTHADERIDFCHAPSIAHLAETFDLVFCFDTLEHIADPVTFCANLLSVTRPGGFIYLSTVFNFVYHPSPEDYFRFSPTGLRAVFSQASSAGHAAEILWTDWESDDFGVAILLYRGKAGQRTFPAPPPARAPWTAPLKKKSIFPWRKGAK